MPREHDRPFFKALLYERDGDLNLGQLFCLILGIIGAIGFLWVIILNPASSVFERIAAWSFLGASFTAVLIAAVPIARAKILASSRLPGEVARGIASVSQGVEATTDLSEMLQQNPTTNDNNPDIG